MSWEILAFLLLAVLCSLWERLRPGWRTDRLAEVKLDLLPSQDHRVHHATGLPVAANFAFVFSIWDRCFGTYVDGDSMPKDYPLGLGEPVDPRRAPRMLLGA